MSVVVENAKLDKNCEGCVAAERALDGWRKIAIVAKKKISEQSEEIIMLREKIKRMESQ